MMKPKIEFKVGDWVIWDKFEMWSSSLCNKEPRCLKYPLIAKLEKYKILGTYDAGVIIVNKRKYGVCCYYENRIFARLALPHEIPNYKPQFKTYI